MKKVKKPKGFRAMSKAAARVIQRKGGLTVSRNRKHMADIGRVGGSRKVA